jgi:hypothetical protein
MGADDGVVDGRRTAEVVGIYHKAADGSHGPAE